MSMAEQQKLNQEETTGFRVNQINKGHTSIYYSKEENRYNDFVLGTCQYLRFIIMDSGFSSPSIKSMK